MNVLLVDDDDETRRHIVSGLIAAGNNVTEAADGASALRWARTRQFDVIVLDRLLPDRDGVQVVKTLRSEATATPVLMLTAVGDVDARVEGIESGADDYLVKPFAFVELSARLMALARRSIARESQVMRLQVGDLTMDLAGRTVTRAGVNIPLQPREFLLLEYLMRHCGQTVTRTMLLQNVWKFDFDPQTSIVETHISRLRSKINREFSSGELIDTVRGEGYVLRSAPRPISQE